MVAAVVAERQLVGRAAEGGGQQLVAEADAEHRHLAEQAADGLDGVADRGRDHRGRSTGTRRRAGGPAPSAAVVDAGTTSTVAMLAELGQDRPLDAEVVGHDPAGTVADGVGLGAGDQRRPGRVPSVPGSSAAACLSVASSAVPNAPGMAPASRRWRVRRRVSMPAMPGTPWRRRKASRSASLRQLLRRRARSRTMTPRQKGRALSSSAGRHAVVADVGVGEGDDLPGVGRVGDDLLVAGQHGVEHDLAGGDAPAARRRWPRPRRWCRRPARAAPR